MVRVEIYSVSLPYVCHCCADFSSDEQGAVLIHLAERSHHDAHTEFIAVNGDLAQYEIDALKAFDLYEPPKELSRTAKFLARITTTPIGPPKEHRVAPWPRH